MKKKIIIKIKGGLGNQMFQYAFYTYLKSLGYLVKFRKSRNKNDFHYGIELEKAFGLKLAYINIFEILKLKVDGFLLRFFKNTLFYKRIIENDELSCPKEIINCINLNSSIYLDGFFQNQDFFNSVSSNIKQKLDFKINCTQLQLDYLKKIKKSNSIAIHIRRGDYMNFENRYGNIATIEYYKKAIKYMESNIKNATFFIFSDDLNWCREEFKSNLYYYVDCNNEESSFYDMYFISKCKHQIIANSTFSWWGAYLNNNPNKIVVRPKKWVNLSINHPKQNIFLSEWVQLDY